MKASTSQTCRSHGDAFAGSQSSLTFASTISGTHLLQVEWHLDRVSRLLGSCSATLNHKRRRGILTSLHHPPLKWRTRFPRISPHSLNGKRQVEAGQFVCGITLSLKYASEKSRGRLASLKVQDQSYNTSTLVVQQSLRHFTTSGHLEPCFRLFETPHFITDSAMLYRVSELTRLSNDKPLAPSPRPALLRMPSHTQVRPYCQRVR